MGMAWLFMDDQREDLDFMVPWATLRAGETLAEGRYAVEGTAEGPPPGHYYLGRDTLTRQAVALRLIRLRELPRDEERWRLRHDLRHAASIPHPYIVRALDAQERDDALALVSEPRHMTLRETLDTRRLSLDEVFTYARQIAAALAFAHAHGVVHGALTPATVDLTPDQATAGGFGGSGALEAPPATARVDGFGLIHVAAHFLEPFPFDRERSDHYLAPEEQRAPRQVAPALIPPVIDSYHFGALLWEMATGTAPHDLVSDLLAANELPAELREIITACMRPDPVDRATDLAAMGAHLRVAQRAMLTRTQPLSDFDVWLGDASMPPHQPRQSATPSRPIYPRPTGAEGGASAVPEWLRPAEYPSAPLFDETNRYPTVTLGHDQGPDFANTRQRPAVPPQATVRGIERRDGPTGPRPDATDARGVPWRERTTPTPLARAPAPMPPARGPADSAGAAWWAAGMPNARAETWAAPEAGATLRFAPQARDLRSGPVSRPINRIAPVSQPIQRPAAPLFGSGSAARRAVPLVPTMPDADEERAEATTPHQATGDAAWRERLTSAGGRQVKSLALVGTLVAVLAAAVVATGLLARRDINAAPQAITVITPHAGVTVLAERATPYLITKPIILTTGETLRVAPGATVAFAPGAGITVRGGVLDARGTAAAPILLTAAADVATPGGTAAAGAWPGLALVKAADGSPSRVMLDYATVRDAGATGAAAITCDSGSLTFTNGVQSDSAGAGLKAGLDCWGEIAQNTFERDAADAADIATTAVRFHDNTVLGLTVTLP